MGVDVFEVVMIFEGMKCDDGKVCLNCQCVLVNVFFKKVFGCVKNCLGNGICSNVGICYCFELWIGDFCSEKIDDVKLIFKVSQFIKILFYSIMRMYLFMRKLLIIVQMMFI